MLGIDDVVFVDVEVKGVVRVLGVVRVAALRLGPGNHLTHVLDEGLALGDVLHGKHPLAMDAGAASLDAAAGRNGGLLGHVRKIW